MGYTQLVFYGRWYQSGKTDSSRINGWQWEWGIGDKWVMTYCLFSMPVRFSTCVSKSFWFRNPLTMLLSSRCGTNHSSGFPLQMSLRMDNSNGGADVFNWCLACSAPWILSYNWTKLMTHDCRMNWFCYLEGKREEQKPKKDLNLIKLKNTLAQVGN